MTEVEIKYNVKVALMAYSTHNKAEVSVDQWFKAQDAKRNDDIVSKRYKTLVK